MAVRPVPDALMLELDPVVGENLDRHIGTEQIWFAHDFVPFEQGENFAFLGGRDWDASQVTLPKAITNACEILLITKDNLAGYHRELVEHFILELNWHQWIGRWTAEEHLHAIALREYFVVTREIDPTANEDVRFEHVSSKGYRASQYSKIETLVFMTLFEGASAAFSNNLAAQIEEPVLAGLIAHIARDDVRHEEFFANLVAHLLTSNRDETVTAIAARAAEMEVIGADIDAYADKLRIVADAGIFGPDQLRQVISDRITDWGVADEPALRQFVSS